MGLHGPIHLSKVLIFMAWGTGDWLWEPCGLSSMDDLAGKQRALGWAIYLSGPWRSRLSRGLTPSACPAL